MRLRIVIIILLGVLLLIACFALAARSMHQALKAMHAAAEAFLLAHPDSSSVRAGIFSVAAGPPAPAPSFVLVHGSPGNWSDFGEYVADSELTAELRVIALDRPGYGRSNPGATTPPSLRDQASRLAAWAEGLPAAKRYWLGHSFGASIVARLAMDRPDLVDGVILLAGAMDPRWEEPRWFHALAATPLGLRTLPEAMLFANAEALAYHADLSAMEPDWSLIQCPVIIIHARNDRLADFRHVAFTQERLDPARTEVLPLQDGNHFLPWNRRPLVQDAMRRMAGLDPSS